MVTGVGITDTIKSLSDLQVRCNLRQADSDRLQVLEGIELELTADQVFGWLKIGRS